MVVRGVVVVAACVVGADAGVVEYEFSGVVEGILTPVPAFAGVEVGTPFSLVVTLDGDAMPTFDQPGDRRWGRDAYIAVHAIVGGAAFPVYTGIENVSAFLQVEDNDPGESNQLRDSFNPFLDFTPVGRMGILYITEVSADEMPGGSPALSGLDLPDAAEVDPARWQVADMSIGGLFGDIRTARIIPSSGAIALLGTLACVHRRRRTKIGDHP